MAVKTFLTYKQQIDKLRDEKGLLIPDEAAAEAVLKKVSYYSLISGYKGPFKFAASGKYRRGVTFDEITALYYFDEGLRTVFLRHILHVERMMKSMISYHFCEKHGDSQTEYLDINNYAVTSANRGEVTRLVNILTDVVTLPSSYPYITHYISKYSNVPLWVAMNAVTFGQLSKMYQYIPNDVQSRVSRNFINVTEKQLHQFIRLLSSCRNICAHGERLYSFRTREAISDMQAHQNLGIRRKRGQYVQGKHDLFAAAVSLRYLLEDEEFDDFSAAVSALISEVLAKCPHISQTKLLNDMGFPPNWLMLGNSR